VIEHLTSDSYVQNYYKALKTGGLAAISVAWITVTYQSIKAAAANPIDSLRQE